MKKQESDFLYDLTILIPIYNGEHHLETTINSVVKQKVKDFTYEVLLINDGSTDDSEKICQKYSKLYDNFNYYNHSNKGVSYTRNRGLKLAKGRYILFLDSDDLLAQNTLNSVIKTFNYFKGEADILAYPLYRKVNDYITAHIRNKEFNKTGKMNIYDIENYHNLNQCTMNVVVRNLPENEKVYFNENLKQSEDALFNTSMVLKKGKILYSNEGGYLYNIEQYSAVDHYKNPVDIKDMLLDFFENLIKVSKNKFTGKIPKYVQSMILYELNWRFVQNNLYPHHLNKNEFNHWMYRLKEIFQKIDVETILNKNLMDFYHKMYIIKEFKNNLEYINNSYGISFKSYNKTILEYKQMTLVFNKIKIIDNKDIQFVGFVKAPLLELTNEVSLIIEDNQSIIRNIPLSKSPAGYYKTRMNITEFYDFDFKLNLSNINNYKFYIQIDNHKYNVNHWFDNNVIFKKFIGSRFVITKDRIISYNKNTFEIVIEDRDKNKKKAKDILAHQKELMEKGNQEQLLKFKKISKFINPIMKKQRIWLYNDRVGVLDNAYYQFKHDIQKEDGIKRYYIIRKEDKNTISISPKNTVEYGSTKHKLLYYYADLVLTSFKEFIEYSPLSYRANNLFYSEMNSKIIYLQHGVLNAHTPWLYGKHVTNFDKFLTSSKFEEENLKNNYGYNEKDLIKSGMPRLDNISLKKGAKKILIAPSWRKSLINETGFLKRTINKEAFEKSNFYQGLSNLINSDKLNQILKENGYTLDVKMHPIFMQHSSLFTTTQSNINILKENDSFNLNDYNLFITDFSSYMFDFIKAKTKIIFFFPDYDYFLSGNHVYNKLDYDISKISKIITNSNELINILEKEIKNSFIMNTQLIDLYNDFYYTNNNYKETLYSKLIEL